MSLPPPATTLPPGVVDVWLTDPDRVTADAALDLLAVLDPEERARNARFRVEPARRQHLVAHALLRRTLTRYTGIDPAEWRFGANSYGRPHIEGPALEAPLHFNLSHTDGLVALAVAASPDVGVDVERESRQTDIDRLAPAVFSKTEREAFGRCPGQDRRALFFTFWTLKEAYIKARGMGLSLPLDGFSFDLGGPEPRIAFHADCPDDPGRWRFWSDRVTPDHRLGLAAPSGTLATRRFRVDPDGGTTGA